MCGNRIKYIIRIITLIPLLRDKRLSDSLKKSSHILGSMVAWYHGCTLYLVDEGSSSEDHGQLTGVVGVVQPAWVSSVPGMEPAGETNYPIPCFSPNSGKKHGKTKAKINRINMPSTDALLTVKASFCRHNCFSIIF